MTCGFIPTLCATLCAATTLLPPTASAAEVHFNQDRLAIGLWGDPPAGKDMDDHYAEMAEANFTFLIGNFRASTLEAVARPITRSQKDGLQVIVTIARHAPD